jgi:predicted MFS family arabinose efflux permease
MAGVGIGVLFMACCLPLGLLPDVKAHEAKGGAAAATRAVAADLWQMLKTRAGLLAALLCFLPVGTGAAQTTLTQEAVAMRWGATAETVAGVQGFAAGGMTAAGCFVGGWICTRLHPRTAYAAIGVVMALVAAGIALSPATVSMYVGWNFLYAFVVGLAYAAFTATVLDAMGPGSAATKYNTFASLSNFPIWWLGLVLGRVADKVSPRAMLYTEAAIGLVGVVVFLVATRLIKEARPELVPAVVPAS